MILHALVLLLIFYTGVFLVNYFFKTRICAMCTSVCATWVVLSVWHLFFGGVDIVLLSVLMGGSAVGGMYYLFSKVPKRYGIFRFPLLLTLFFAIYAFVMQKLSLSSREFAILIGLWIIVGIVFIYKKKSI